MDGMILRLLSVAQSRRRAFLLLLASPVPRWRDVNLGFN
jgi:hypothetical protein